jgi:uncharacterized damage-inducible protein DinB
VTTNPLTTLMQHKQWIDAAFYDLAGSLEVANRPELQREVLYWLSHIHIVDQIFFAHLTGKTHAFTSTVSDAIPELDELRGRSAALNGALIELAASMSSQAAQEVVEFVFTDGMLGAMSRQQMLVHLSTHGLYHLSVTGTHLIKAGVAMPPVLLTTMLHRH